MLKRETELTTFIAIYLSIEVIKFELKKTLNPAKDILGLFFKLFIT